tara:strand:+ start:11644 stop:11817 length:174 start_codon:yes stop_codon:yes gene_type:complete
MEKCFKCTKEINTETYWKYKKKSACNSCYNEELIETNDGTMAGYILEKEGWKKFINK